MRATEGSCNVLSGAERQILMSVSLAAGSDRRQSHETSSRAPVCCSGQAYQRCGLPGSRWRMKPVPSVCVAAVASVTASADCRASLAQAARRFCRLPARCRFAHHSGGLQLTVHNTTPWAAHTRHTSAPAPDAPIARLPSQLSLAAACNSSWSSDTAPRPSAAGRQHKLIESSAQGVRGTH